MWTRRRHEQLIALLSASACHSNNIDISIRNDLYQHHVSQESAEEREKTSLSTASNKERSPIWNLGYLWIPYNIWLRLNDSISRLHKQDDLKSIFRFDIPCIIWLPQAEQIIVLDHFFCKKLFQITSLQMLFRITYFANFCSRSLLYKLLF